MSLVRWRPVYTLTRPWRTFDRLLDRFLDDDLSGARFTPFQGGMERALYVPPVDVCEEDGHVVVRAELPGIEKDDVKLHATADQLTIDAEHKTESERDEGRYYRREMHAGRYHRCIPLPTEVKHQEAKATFRDGILEVRIPKTQEAVGRTIEIE